MLTDAIVAEEKGDVKVSCDEPLMATVEMVRKWCSEWDEAGRLLGGSWKGLW